jgi:F0F1-type ATP synthase delta subunit
MTTTPQQYAQAWYQILISSKKKPTKSVIKKLLTHLYRHGKFSWLAEIVRSLQELEQRQSNKIFVTITTSHEHEKAVIEKVAQEILKTTKLNITHRIEKDLLRGMQIETTNKRWDLSLRNHVIQLRKQLAI